MKVTIVGGAGGVGASTAFNLVLLRRGIEVVLVDTRPTMITSHTMDFEQVVELAPGSAVRGGDAGDVADADVLVISAATSLTLNRSRLVYLAENTRIVDEIVGFLPPGWPGIALVVTNPVDPLVTRLRLRTGIDRRRVLGYTLNDSLRLRTALGRVLGVDPGRIDAWALGEHGDASVPLFGRVTVDGEPSTPSTAEAATAEREVRTWYERHVALDSGRSSTWTTGLGLAAMVAALADGGGEPWPASVVLDGEYGIAGVAITVPVLLGPGGAEEILEWELAPGELGALRASAEVVRGQLRGS